jgi:hypothetical protein
MQGDPLSARSSGTSSAGKQDSAEFQLGQRIQIARQHAVDAVNAKPKSKFLDKFRKREK